MRAAGIEGARRTKWVRTTRPDPEVARHPDLVERAFRSEAPNRRWVTDLTYWRPRPGWPTCVSTVDAFSRMIVGWWVASHMRTSMVLDALEMARWSRGTLLEGLAPRGRGRPSRTSSSRPWIGCIGTTRAGLDLDWCPCDRCTTGGTPSPAADHWRTTAFMNNKHRDEGPCRVAASYR